MSGDHTIPQDEFSRRESQQRSLQERRPPCDVPGYECERLLGVGAYGEVWLGRQKNTGRQVAIKFYSHRRGVDWALLSHEVEKLSFMFGDRYVVQLMAVGWEADPPYYVMEYMASGSLADRLQAGPLPVPQAVSLFREIAQGLLHAHNRGILHCDLKPANVLLDPDGHPRLADFGQARLSHEQLPALGTLFYMAPEQADLNAVPDARWDVYALGALLYCMLTGTPPYRTEEIVRKLEAAGSLSERLRLYREFIRNSPPPTMHRRVRGVDRALAEIVDRCLAVDPRERFPNVQAVLSALRARDIARAQRPLLVVGAVGPALVLCVIAMFAWRGFSRAIEQSQRSLVNEALQRNGFAAEFVAKTAAGHLERRFRAVNNLATSPQLREAIKHFLETPGMEQLLEKLSDPGPLRDPNQEQTLLEPLREQFRRHPARLALEKVLLELIPQQMRPPISAGQEEDVASWFFCDRLGNSVVRIPYSDTVGKNYAWRSFFHGGNDDLEHVWDRPPKGKHIEQPTLSAVFRSQAHNQWIVAIACPVYEDPENKKGFLGVLALTVRVGRFMELESGGEKFRPNQAAVLVDERPGKHRGMVLQHPLFQQVPQLSEAELSAYRLPPEQLPLEADKAISFIDPLAPLALRWGRPFNCTRWLAQAAPVRLAGRHTGWWVIVQEPYDGYPGTIGWAVSRLKRLLIWYGILALCAVVVIMIGLWAIAIRLLRQDALPALSSRVGLGDEFSTSHTAELKETETFKKTEG